jgi:hypothetical protein
VKTGILLGLEAVVGLLLLSGWKELYFRSRSSRPDDSLLLTLVYTLLWVMIFKKENSFQNWRECVVYIGIGLVTTVIQIGLFDWIRWSLTGSWAGFQI